MGEPLYKVQHNEEDQQLYHWPPLGNVDQCQTFHRNTQIAEQKFQQLVRTTDHNGEDEEVEEHIECVQPKIGSDHRLFLPPREQDLQEPHNKGDRNKPPEIVRVPRDFERDRIPGPIRCADHGVDACIQILIHLTVLRVLFHGPLSGGFENDSTRAKKDHRYICVYRSMPMDPLPYGKKIQRHAHEEQGFGQLLSSS